MRCRWAIVVMIGACSPAPKPSIQSRSLPSASASETAPPTPPAPKLALGTSHSCALSDGRVSCWGNAEAFDGVESLEGVERLGAGEGFTCVLAAGVVRCFGERARAEPLTVGNAEHLACSRRRCCAASERAATCIEVDMRRRPTRVAFPAGVRELAVVEKATCGLLEDGRVHCARVGEVDGLVKNVVDAVAIAAGDEGACAVMRSGQVACWSESAKEKEEVGIAKPVKAVANAVAIAVGSYRCALRKNGAISCWKRKRKGQSQKAHETMGIGRVASLAVGGSHMCAASDEGIFCWGHNRHGEVDGHGVEARWAARRVAGVRDAVGLTAREDHTCAWNAKGELHCWGSDFGKTQCVSAPELMGTLPNARFFANRGLVALRNTELFVLRGDEFEAVSKNVAAVADGMVHSCTLTTSGKVGCAWAEHHVPRVKLDWADSTLGLPPIEQLSARRDGTCVIDQSKRAWCWGVFPRSWVQPKPLRMSSLGDAVSLDIDARGRVCAIDPTGRVRCAAANDDPYDYSKTPVEDATAVALSDDQHCALRRSGEVACWPMPSSGGVLMADNKPRRVKNLSGATAIVAGGTHRCALDKTGAVMCWGIGGRCQLGDASPNFHDKPVRLPQPSSRAN